MAECMEYPYFSSQVVISTNQDGSPTQNNVESAAVVEKDKSELKQFKEGIYERGERYACILP